jgi:hypothetical protein
MNKFFKLTIFIVLILGIIAAVLVYVYNTIRISKKHEYGSSAVGFRYENPSGNSYYIIFDKVDSVKVPPMSMCSHLPYLLAKNQNTIDVGIYDNQFHCLEDTVLDLPALEAEFKKNIRDKFYQPSTYDPYEILINPSRENFFSWKVWYGEGEINHLKTVEINGDTLYADAVSTNSFFIFPELNPEFATSVEWLNNKNTIGHVELLVSQQDFLVAYTNLYCQSSNEKTLNDFRNKLVSLYNKGMHFNYYDLHKANETESQFYKMIPPPITSSTEGKDFQSVIILFKKEIGFFDAVNRELSNSIFVESDSILSLSSRNEKISSQPLPGMHDIKYGVSESGFWQNIRRRYIEGEWPREQFHYKY